MKVNTFYLSSIPRTRAETPQCACVNVCVLALARSHRPPRGSDCLALFFFIAPPLVRFSRRRPFFHKIPSSPLGGVQAFLFFASFFAHFIFAALMLLTAQREHQLLPSGGSPRVTAAEP